MQRMRRETHELRVLQAWGVATHQRQLSENARSRLDAFILPFLRARKDSYARRVTRVRTKQKQTTVVPRQHTRDAVVVAAPYTVFDCTRITLSNARIKFTNRDGARFETSTILLSSTIGGDGIHRCYRGYFYIITDHQGNTLKSFRVTSPPIDTSTDDIKVIRTFIENYMFEVYVRIMSRMRLYMHMADANEPLLAFDTNDDIATGINLSTPTVLDCTQLDAARDAEREAHDLCFRLGIPTPTLFTDSEDSTDSNSSCSFA